jgi:hypothetical protein
MISAHEANKITADSVTTYLMDIEEGIKKNAALGKYSYEHLLDAEDDIVDSVREKLEKHDFTVTTESTFGFDCVWRIKMTISWEPNEETPEEN